MKYIAAVGICISLGVIAVTVAYLAMGGPFRPSDAGYLTVNVGIIAFLTWMAREFPSKRKEKP